MNKKKILVTGGTGYIGSHTIIEIIRTTDFDVISVDNYINSSFRVLGKIKDITSKAVKNYDVDLCHLESTREVFRENSDIVGVIHFAALKSVPDSVADPIFYYHNNINSLLNILKCCEEFNIENFIFSSSCSVYGNVQQLPVSEETPLSNVESPYAHTKVLGEEMIRFFVNSYPINTILLRYFNPVGADKSGKIGENPVNKPNNLVPVITQTAIGIIPKLTVYGGDLNTRDGSCIRDYVHVSDIALAHIKALEYLILNKERGRLEIFNLGTGHGISVLEAIKAFEKVSGVKLNFEIGPPRFGDVQSIYSDSSKAERYLGWKPRYGIDEMLETAWRWQQELSKEQIKSN